MRKFGLLGKNISYSFSKTYFKEKFEKESITDASYENFDINTITAFPGIIKNTAQLQGLNVTIPYKESVIPYLDKLNKKAKIIGAVNTIKISKKGKLIGYNTDCYGFEKSIEPHLKAHHKTALILGTGGASKAIAYSLRVLNIDYTYVSRNPSNQEFLAYENLTEADIKNHLLIINCTPLGTHPNIDECPNIPYNAVTANHILFDLIYNPEASKFIKLGKKNNAITINGHLMLTLQAEKAWRLWNS